MKQCERCLKYVDVEGSHESKPTEYIKDLEFKVKRLQRIISKSQKVDIRYATACGAYVAFTPLTKKPIGNVVSLVVIPSKKGNGDFDFMESGYESD